MLMPLQRCRRASAGRSQVLGCVECGAEKGTVAFLTCLGTHALLRLTSVSVHEGMRVQEVGFLDPSLEPALRRLLS